MQTSLTHTTMDPNKTCHCKPTNLPVWPEPERLPLDELPAAPAAAPTKAVEVPELKLSRVCWFPTTVRRLLEHPAWDGFISDKLGNDLFISDPERANRNHEAAEHGEDGSFPAEHIEDWREFAAILEREYSRACETDADEIELANAVEDLEADIAKCELWHETNGSLYKI